MQTATIDGLKVNYLVQGSGPHLLMLAPGCFDAEIWDVLPPHQNGANVLSRILAFKNVIEERHAAQTAA